MNINLPQIPDCKKWGSKSTPEQDVLFKVQHGIVLNQNEIEILNCAYSFYIEAIKAMKSINLSTLTHEDTIILKKYLFDVINMEFTFQNQVHVGLVYRMTWVRDYNMDRGKVRDPKFLGHTDLNFIKQNRKFGRANTYDTTCLYLAESAQVAVFECKPKPGDNVIITGWSTVSEDPLIVYPVNFSSKVNLGVKKATEALDKKLYDSNQYFARMIKIIQDFIGAEFVKDVPIISENCYEYFFSAYFADKIWNSNITAEDVDNPPFLGQYDGIIYPSIATQYNYDNLAVRESSIPKLKPLFCRQFLVKRVDYKNFNGTSDQLPFEGDLIRSCEDIGATIKWDDD